MIYLTLFRLVCLIMCYFYYYYRSVQVVKDKFPKELELFKKCLDDKDYRFADCRKQEKSLLDCWNNKSLQ